MAETFVPMPSDASAVSDVEEAAEMLRSEGISIRYVRSILIPGDETCFHVFDAASIEVVRDALRRVGIQFERIVPVAEVRGHHF